MPAKYRFLLLGEPIALDLVNTRVRRNGVDADLLDSPAALSAWLRAERGRIAWTGAVSAVDLEALTGLRDAIDHLLRVRCEGTQPIRTALERVNHVLTASAAQARLDWGVAGPILKSPSASAKRSAVLRALAADAVALLTGPLTERVRKCAHPDCRLRFVARNPRRRWCSGTRCGNRTRVAKHYRLHNRAG